MLRPRRTIPGEAASREAGTDDDAGGPLICQACGRQLAARVSGPVAHLVGSSVCEACSTS